MIRMRLPLEELKSKLESLKASDERWGVVREIGSLLIDKKQKEAEPVLRKLLTGEFIEDKAVSFAYLLALQDPEPETIKAMEEFRKDPKNKDIIEFAEEEVERYNRFNG